MTASNQQLKKQVYKPYEDPVTLGKNTILRCSACDLPLVDILVTRPELQTLSKVTAKCWKCGDKSYEQAVNGGFHFAATKKSSPADINTDIDVNGDIKVIINTTENKSKDDGKI